MEEIEDDIIQYIFDTLEWVPIKNPSRNGLQNMMGLNYHGVTIFNKESSNILKNVLNSWRSLFESSPNTIIELTGSYFDGDGPEDFGEYEKFKVNKKVLNSKFDKLVLLTEKLEDDEYYLLHSGI